MARTNLFDVNLPAHAHKPDNTLFVSTGIPATSFNTSTGDADQFDGGSGNPPIELGIKTHLRFGADIENTSIDGSGEININVPSGSFVGNPNLAKWNFTYDVDQLPVSGRAANDLTEKTIHLLIDMNPGNGVKYLDLHAEKDFDGDGNMTGLKWVATDSVFVPAGTVVISDDGFNNAYGGLSNVSQNSQNLGFYKALFTSAYNWTAGGHFDVALVQTNETEGPVPVNYNTTTGNLIGIPADNAYLHLEYNFV